MLIEEAEIRTLLGIDSSITDNERGVLTLVVPAACQRVIEFLGYDPEQASRTELLPRHSIHGGPGVASPSTDWDVNAGHSRAVLDTSIGSGYELQCTYLPIRAVTSLRVDTASYHGQASGAFGASTAYTQGTEYWIEFDEALSGDSTKGLCRSGCLIGSSSWPLTPGTVQVTYRAGYSKTELQGRATSDAEAADGTITQDGVNASGIKRAALLTAIKGFHTWAAFQKSSQAGFVAGTMKSENLGDYGYTLGDGGDLTSLTIALPPEAKEELQPFRHYGLMRL